MTQGGKWRQRWRAPACIRASILVVMAAWAIPAAAQTVADPGASAGSAQQGQADALHPLNNKVWRAATGEFVTIPALVTALAAAPIVLIGERHGLSPHQDRAAFLLEAFADKEHYPAVALEMLEPRQGLLIERYRKEEPEYAGRLGAALQWYNTGWPAWPFYEPIFAAAFTAKLPIVAGDLAKAEQERIERSTSVLAAPEQGIDASWQASMKTAHCDLIEPDRLQRVAALQWQRDRAMAQALAVGIEKAGQVVLLAGREHVRRDRGVLRHVEAGQARSALVLALVETKPGEVKPQNYLPVAIAGKPEAVYDYVWFTPAKEGANSCDRIRAIGLATPVAPKK